MRKNILVLAMCLLCSSAFAQQSVRWLRYPAISPDGSTIVFGYMGNLYKVSSSGGVATPVTSGDDYCQMPVWSRDGKTLAYASDKFGNFDVFTMPAEGGVPVRLTYNSAADYPYDFTPDSKNVIFGSGRFAPAKDVRFPITIFKNLYTIPAKGGRAVLLTSAGMDEAHYNSTGSEIVFLDKKGYEDFWRKHHTSGVTRDVWIWNIKSNTYRQISDFKGEDRDPLFSPDDKYIYYTNEKSGALNLYKRNIANGSEKQMTSFKNFPIREVSISGTGIITFVWKGDIYTIKDGTSAKKLDIKIANNAGYEAIKTLPINSTTEIEVSPNGKEIALVNRGEVFVVGVNDSRTKRITNTPYQERMVSWSPDGKDLYYSAEKDGCWGIYKTSLKDTTEKYFYASTMLETEPVIANGGDNYQSKISPDGKKIAYVSERNILKIMDLKSKKTVTVLPKGHNHSYSDWDWDFEWSPDSQWIICDDSRDRMANQNTALMKADGTGEIIYPMNAGEGDYNGKWGMKGKVMLSHTGGQVYAVFFDQKEYDRFLLSKEDFDLLTEKEKTEKAEKEKVEKAAADKAKGKGGKKEGKKEEKKDEKDKVEPVKMNLDGLEERKVAVTNTGRGVISYIANKDLSKVYYVAMGDKDADLWVVDTRKKDAKILAKGVGFSTLQMSKDESDIFLISNGRLMKVDAKSGEMKPVSINGKMELDAAGERAYIYDHAWLQVKKKYYDPTIHGVDWKMYHDEYAKFLPYINNNYDFQVLLSELLGELNGSHTGGRYYVRGGDGDKTASFGFLADEKYTGAGIKVSEIIKGGPLDKVENKIKAGDVITAIDGEEIKANENYNKKLNNISNVNVSLTVKSSTGTFNQTARPVNQGSISVLMYNRWVKRMEFLTDSLSHGQLGYVHVEGMDQPSYKVVYNKLMGKYLDKKAVIVDTRFNGGGWLHDQLATLLSGKLYMKYAPQNDVLKDGEPLGRWIKPSIVLMCEANYSDAFMFPFIYQQNKIGKLVGMPVAGTGTAVWWETQIDNSIVFGIPMVASMGLDGKVTENRELDPDIRVELKYNDFMNGEDTQLEAAVKELMKEVK